MALPNQYQFGGDNGGANPYAGGNSEEVTSNYKNLFNRSGSQIDQQGQDYWNNSGLTGSALTSAMQGSADQIAQGPKVDGTAVSNYSSNGTRFDAQGQPVNSPAPYAAPAASSYGGQAAPSSSASSSFSASSGTPFVAPALAAMRGYEKNPYLDQMAGGITSQMNDNFTRNVLPSLGSGAMAAGGFGGSRHGVTEANAMNDMNRSLGQNLSNLYGGDYQQQMQRNLQEYQGNQQYNIGLGNNANQRLSINNQFALGNRGFDSNERIAGMSNATNMRGQDLNYNLGLRQNDTSMYGINTNAATARYGVDAGTANNRYSTDAATATARAANNTANRGIDANYDLGLRGNDLGYANLDSSINQNNFNNNITGANFGLDVYKTQQGGNNAGVTAGKDIQNTPLDYQTYFNNAGNAAGGLGDQTNGTATGPAQQGSALTGALGGMQLGNSIYKQFSGGGSNTPYQGYDPVGQYGNGLGSYLTGNSGSGG